MAMAKVQRATGLAKGTAGSSGLGVGPLAEGRPTLPDEQGEGRQPWYEATQGLGLALAVYMVRPDKGIVLWQWLGVQALAVAGIGYLLGKRYGWALGAAFVYTLLSALWAGSEVGWYSAMDLADKTILGKNTGLLAWSALPVAALALALPHGWADRGLWAVVSMTLLSAFHVCLSAMTTRAADVGGWGGLLGNPSMSGMMIGVFAPLAISSVHRLLGWRTAVACLCMVTAACVLTRSSMGFAALVVSLAAWAAFSWRHWLDHLDEEILMLVVVMIAVVTVIYFWTDPAAFSSNGRTEVWAAATNWLLDRDAWLFGMGAGTTPAWLPALQDEVGSFGRTRFLFLHNEWLQFFFELGAVGAGICVWAAMSAFKRALDRPVLAACLTALFVTATFNWPLRSGPFAYAVVILVAAIMDKVLLHSAQALGQKTP